MVTEVTGLMFSLWHRRRIDIQAVTGYVVELTIPCLLYLFATTSCIADEHLLLPYKYSLPTLQHMWTASPTPVCIFVRAVIDADVERKIKRLV